MKLILHIPEKLAAMLTAAGADLEHLALAALQHTAEQIERGQPATTLQPAGRTSAEAASRIRASRPRNVLPNNVTIKDLMTHGRA